MLPCLDIFKIDPLGGVLWRGSVKSLVVAEARIKMLALSFPGDYLILNEDTGQRDLVTGSSLPHTDPLLWEDEDSACCTLEQAGALCYQKS